LIDIKPFHKTSYSLKMIQLFYSKIMVNFWNKQIGKKKRAIKKKNAETMKTTVKITFRSMRSRCGKGAYKKNFQKRQKELAAINADVKRQSRATCVLFARLFPKRFLSQEKPKSILLPEFSPVMPKPRKRQSRSKIFHY